MLDTVRDIISNINSQDIPFSSFYNTYVMKIQDMDIDNEILPLIKQQSTEYLDIQKKLLRQRNRSRKKFAHDMSQ